MAQIENLVNKFGKMSGWNSATYNLYGNDVVGILDFGYDDNIEFEAVKGAGQMPIGISEGDYEANTSLTLYQEEVNAILESIPPGKRISDAVAQDVVVQYKYNNRIVTDIIRGFKITGFGKEVKQGDKTIAIKMNVFCTHIDWNVQ